jgi:hypothetical protein
MSPDNGKMLWSIENGVSEESRKDIDKKWRRHSLCF